MNGKVADNGSRADCRARPFRGASQLPNVTRSACLYVATILGDLLYTLGKVLSSGSRDAASKRAKDYSRLPTNVYIVDIY